MINGQNNDRLYGWEESEKSWKNDISNSILLNMGFGKKGRPYKIDKTTNKIYK